MSGLTFLSIVFIAASYGAAGLFFGGFLYKLYGYAVTPSPLKIPTTPQPTTVGGVTGKVVLNVAAFANLFRGNRWTWVGGIALHLILLLVLLRHLRFFVEPVGALVALAQPFGMWAGILMPLPLIYLYVRRKAVDRVAYISSAEDSFLLILLFLVALSGITLKTLTHTDIVSVKQFILGLVMLSPVNMPTHPVFLIHFTLVLLLAACFPFTKLLHAGGIFFSPTLTQVDNPREVRHVTPWAQQER